MRCISGGRLAVASWHLLWTSRSTGSCGSDGGLVFLRGLLLFRLAVPAEYLPSRDRRARHEPGASLKPAGTGAGLVIVTYRWLPNMCRNELAVVYWPPGRPEQTADTDTWRSNVVPLKNSTCHVLFAAGVLANTLSSGPMLATA